MYRTTLSLLIILGLAIASPVQVEKTSQATHQIKHVPIKTVRLYLNKTRLGARGLVSEFQGVIDSSPHGADVDHHRHIAKGYLPKAIQTIVTMREAADSMLRRIDENGLESPQLMEGKQDCHQLKKSIDAIKEMAIENLCSQLKRQEIIAYFKSDLNCLLGSIFELWRATERDGTYFTLGYRDIVQTIKNLLVAIETGTRRFAEEINYMDFSKECQKLIPPEMPLTPSAKVQSQPSVEKKAPSEEGKKEKSESKDEGKGVTGISVVAGETKSGESSLVEKVEKVIKLEKKELDDIKAVAKKELEKVGGKHVNVGVAGIIGGNVGEKVKEAVKEKKEEAEVNKVEAEKAEEKKETEAKTEDKKEKSEEKKEAKAEKAEKAEEKKEKETEKAEETKEKEAEKAEEKKEKETEKAEDKKEKEAEKTEEKKEKEAEKAEQKKEKEAEKAEEKKEKEAEKAEEKKEKEAEKEKKVETDDKKEEKAKETVVEKVATGLLPVAADTNTTGHLLPTTTVHLLPTSANHTNENVGGKLKVILTKEENNLNAVLKKLDENNQTTAVEAEKVEEEKKEIKKMQKELEKVIADVVAIEALEKNKTAEIDAAAVAAVAAVAKNHVNVSIIDVITKSPVVNAKLTPKVDLVLPTVVSVLPLLTTVKPKLPAQAPTSPQTNLKEVENEEKSLENLRSYGKDFLPAPEDKKSDQVLDSSKTEQPKEEGKPAAGVAVDANDIDAMEERDEEERAKEMVEKAKEEEEKKKEQVKEAEKVAEVAKLEEEKKKEEQKKEAATENKPVAKMATATSKPLPIPAEKKNSTFDGLISHINDEEDEVRNLIQKLNG